MNLFRRRELPEALRAAAAAFDDVLAEVEPAKAAITSVMPSTRMPGLPLPDALMVFESRLSRARELMPRWRRPETEEVWCACDAGLAEAAERARRFREEAPDLGGFEGLIWAVEHLMAPLDPFAQAETRFQDLRTSAR
jgi:hypothetical protein